MSDPLWFFWSGNHLTFLRWMTLVSAATVHDNVILIRRRPDPELHQSEREAASHWHENQDFQQAPIGKNWIDEIPENVKQVDLEEFEPEIAALRAPDVQTSDLLGWKILGTRGGSVADMDVLFFGSLPEITHYVQAVVCTGWPKAGYMPIGFLQGKPCAYWQEMYRRARERYDPKVYESCGANLFLPWDQIPEPKRLLPESIVYPFALRAEWMQWHPWMFETNDWPRIPDECIGAHWYGGKNQDYNWAITPENVTHMRGMIPTMIRPLLAMIKVSA